VVEHGAVDVDHEGSAAVAGPHRESGAVGAERGGGARPDLRQRRLGTGDQVEQRERAAGVHGLGTLVVGARIVPVRLAEGDVAAVGRPGLDYHRLRCRDGILVPRAGGEVDVDDAGRELVPLGEEHRQAIGCKEHVTLVDVDLIQTAVGDPVRAQQDLLALRGRRVGQCPGREGEQRRPRRAALRRAL